MASKQSAPTPDNKVSANPFVHFVRGNKNLFQTNPLGAILAALLASLVSFGMGLLFIKLLASQISGSTFDTGNLGHFVLEILLIYAAVALITGFFYEVVQRAVLTGTRRQKVSFGSLFPFVGNRYGLTVIIALILGGAFIGWFLLVALGGAIAPALGLFLGLVGLAFLIIFIFRMVYVFMIVIDNEQPKSPKWVMERSQALWRQSGGAVVCYFLLMLLLAIVFSLITPTDSQNSSTFTGSGLQTEFNTTPIISYGSLLISSLFEGLFVLVVSAPLGEIYNQAKKLVDGK